MSFFEAKVYWRSFFFSSTPSHTQWSMAKSGQNMLKNLLDPLGLTFFRWQAQTSQTFSMVFHTTHGVKQCLVVACDHIHGRQENRCFRHGHLRDSKFAGLIWTIRSVECRLIKNQHESESREELKLRNSYEFFLSCGSWKVDVITS